MEQDLLLTGAANKDREGKKTEKANKDRESKKDREGKQRQGKQERQRRQKKTNWYIQKYSYLAMAGGQLPYKEPAGNTASRHSGLYGTCQCPALLNGVFVQWNEFSVRTVSFLRINIPLSEPYHGGTVEQLDTPCWLWTCRSSRLNLLFVKSGSGEGVGTMYWQKTV